MSDHFEVGRDNRGPVQFNVMRDLPSAESEIAAFMLGIIAIFATVIGLTYAAIGLWRVLS